MKASAPSAYDKLAATQAAQPTGTASQSYSNPFAGQFKAGVNPNQLTGQVQQGPANAFGGQGRVAPSLSNEQIGALYRQAAPVRIPISLAVGNRGSSQATFNRLSPAAQAQANAAALRRDAAMAKVQQQVQAQAQAAQAAKNATAQNLAYNRQQWGMTGGQNFGAPIAAMAGQQRMSR